MFLSAVCLLLYLFTAKSTQQSAPGGDGAFCRFQRMYLTAYLMAQGNISVYYVCIYSYKGDNRLIARSQHEMKITRPGGH